MKIHNCDKNSSLGIQIHCTEINCLQSNWSTLWDKEIYHSNEICHCDENLSLWWKFITGRIYHSDEKCIKDKIYHSDESLSLIKFIIDMKICHW